VTIEFRVNLMAENEMTLTCGKPSYLRMKLWKVENGVSSTEPPTTGAVSYGPDEETTHATTHNAGNFNFTYSRHNINIFYYYCCNYYYYYSIIVIITVIIM